MKNPILTFFLLAQSVCCLSQGRSDTLIIGRPFPHSRLIVNGNQHYIGYMVTKQDVRKNVFIQDRKVEVQGDKVMAVQTLYRDGAKLGDSSFFDKKTWVAIEHYSSFQPRSESLTFKSNQVTGFIKWKKPSKQDSLVQYNKSFSASLLNITNSDEILQSLDWHKNNTDAMYNPGADNKFHGLNFLHTEEIWINNNLTIPCYVIQWGNTKIWLDKVYQTVVKKVTEQPDGSRFYKLRIYQ